MYANERPCNDFTEVLEEAKAMNATGTGITGGDPMMARERSIEAIKHLKKEFGPNHHIHLYTSIPFNTKYAKELKEAGLDEIRFHLLKLELEKYIPTIEACAQAGILTGIELPAEPDKAEILEKSELLNTKIKDSNLPEHIRIGPIVRKEKVIIPRSTSVFEKGDLVVFLAKREQLSLVENMFRLSSV